MTTTNSTGTTTNPTGSAPGQHRAATPGSVPAGASFVGRGAAPGVAIAPAALVLEQAAAETPKRIGAQEDFERAKQALDATGEALYELSEKVAEEAGEEEAAIFEAHADFAADPELLTRVKRSIDEGASAADAIRSGFDSFGERLKASSDEYIAARARDIDDVRDQVLATLRGENPTAMVIEEQGPVVIVARDLTPSQTARIPRSQLAGIACEEGSPTAHAAILARAIGIPSVVGVKGLLDAVSAAGNGVTVAIDGTDGTVVVHPTDAERTEFEERIREMKRLEARIADLVNERGRTSDGRRVELAANVNDEATLESLEQMGAEGAGLVRTELLFLDHSEPPTIEEQLEWYVRVLEAFPGQRVVIRTMDIGADKPVPYINLHEENPALGLRGIRLSLDRRELLVNQLTALIRAGDRVGRDAGRLAVMFPMVSRPDELDAVIAVVDDVCESEGATRPELGVMIEVPSAALAARRFARRVDFLSLGTNDLLQYIFAADRVLASVAHLPDILDPDVLRLIGNIVTAAHEERAWVGICGEAAADPAQAAAFVGLGVDELSMTPTAIPRVKDVLRRLSSTELADAVDRARAAEGPDDARRVLTELLDAGAR